MSSTFAQAAEFARANPQAHRQAPPPRRHVAVLELIAGLALVLSIMVAVTAISIGLADGDTLAGWRTEHGLPVALWTVAMLAGLSGLSGLVTWLAPGARRAIRVH